MSSNPATQDPADPYTRAGVNIEAGNALVRAIAPLARSTRRTGSLGGIGGFGGLFDLKATGYHDPILVAATDGVGTKLRVAIDTGRPDSIGIDVVAMNVNDLVVQGAEPLLFLDYFATGKLDVEVARRVVASVAEGCLQAGCALVGGETAEMPGLYADNDYDLAGFALGAVERENVLPLPTVAVGDIVLGLPSAGAHSTGFSLIRRILADKGLRYDDPAPFESSRSLADVLLTPTLIYVKPALAAARAGLVKAMAHITGGGFLDNIPRVVPDHLSVRLDVRAWPLPPLFGWLAHEANLSALALAKTFNAGIGFVLIAAPDQADALGVALESAGFPAYVIGRVESRVGPDGVVLEGTESWPH